MNDEYRYLTGFIDDHGCVEFRYDLPDAALVEEGIGEIAYELLGRVHNIVQTVYPQLKAAVENDINEDIGKCETNAWERICSRAAELFRISQDED